MMTTSDAVLDRLSKILRLATNDGATEGERSSAMEKLQALLQTHQLSLAQVEAAGGATSGAVKRVKSELRASAARPWMSDLMTALASSNFCLHRVDKRQGERARHLLVGRELNVEATRRAYEYLVESLRRSMANEGYVIAVGNRYDPDGTAFLDGAVERLSERLAARRREAEEASRQEASEARGNGTHRELVLSDVYGSEAELNNDALNGFPAGTTAQRRRELEEARSRRLARRDELVAAGVNKTEAWYRANGYGDELVAALMKRKSPLGRARSSASSWTQRDERAWQRKNSAAFRAGRRAGDAVGLDKQVGASATRRLGR